MSKVTALQKQNPTHPHFVLEYLVKNVLPEKCSGDAMKYFYRRELHDLDITIKKCKGYLEPWVLEYWKAGKLRQLDQLKLKFKNSYTLPHHGGIYLITLVVSEELWFYIGQAEDIFSRVQRHKSNALKTLPESFLYFLWKKADAIHFSLLADNKKLKSSPIMNILEQWMSLVFCGLQPAELKSNFSLETLKRIPVAELHRGVGVREPLAQGHNFADFPMRMPDFQYSIIPLKKEWYIFRQSNLSVPKRESFLQGQIFKGAFWRHNNELEFIISQTRFQLDPEFIERLEEGTIRIHCDLRPEGQMHPASIIRGMYSPLKYQDPARRLGIKVNDFGKGTKREVMKWLIKDGDSDIWIPRLNRFVDWLEGRNLCILRPRRIYGNYLHSLEYSTADRYTRHPADVGDR